MPLHFALGSSVVLWNRYDSFTQDYRWFCRNFEVSGKFQVIRIHVTLGTGTSVLLAPGFENVGKAALEGINVSNTTFSSRSPAVEASSEFNSLVRRGDDGDGDHDHYSWFSIGKCGRVFCESEPEDRARMSSRSWTVFDFQLVMDAWFFRFQAAQLIHECWLPLAWSNLFDMRRRGPGPFWTAPAAVAGVIALFFVCLPAGQFFIVIIKVISEYFGQTDLDQNSLS